MFAILFGLSMDYEVLLLSRIRERWVATGDNTRSVAEGIGITGGIITGAALIAGRRLLRLRHVGGPLPEGHRLLHGLAVLIDATIVRGVLVPAFMRVMGRLNWWAPAWVQRAVAKLGLYEGPSQTAGSGDDSGLDLFPGLDPVTNRLPLAGVTILDCSRVFAGPHATMLLADLGAEVWKLEPPAGDETRGWGPPFQGDPLDGLSAYFAAVNRNKRSIVVQREGRCRARDPAD